MLQLFSFFTELREGLTYAFADLLKYFLRLRREYHEINKVVRIGEELHASKLPCRLR